MNFWKLFWGLVPCYLNICCLCLNSSLHPKNGWVRGQARARGGMGNAGDKWYGKIIQYDVERWEKALVARGNHK